LDTRWLVIVPLQLAVRIRRGVCAAVYDASGHIDLCLVPLAIVSDTLAEVALIEVGMTFEKIAVLEDRIIDLEYLATHRATVGVVPDHRIVASEHVVAVLGDGMAQILSAPEPMEVGMTALEGAIDEELHLLGSIMS